MAAAYSDYLPLAVVDLPGCPQNVIVTAFRDAWRRFLRTTEIWRQDLTAINQVEDDTKYDLTPPTGCEILRIVALHVRTADEVTDGEDGQLISQDLYLLNEGASGTTKDELELLWTPTEDVTSGLLVTVALAPQRLYQTIVAELLFDKWADAVVAGAVSELCGQPGKRWTSRVRAVSAYRRYCNGLNEAKGEIVRGRKMAVQGLEA